MAAEDALNPRARPATAAEFRRHVDLKLIVHLVAAIPARLIEAVEIAFDKIPVRFVGQPAQRLGVCGALLQPRNQPARAIDEFLTADRGVPHHRVPHTPKLQASV